MPPLGERIVAYRLTPTQQGQSVIIDAVIHQKGSVLIWVGYGDLTAQPDQLVTFSKLAYDKAVSSLHLG